MRNKSYIINNEPFELLIPNYPKGYDLTILDVTYLRKEKSDDGSWINDKICIAFRDNVTKEKKMITIDHPKYTFYVDNDDIIKHNRFFIEKDKVTPYTCYYDDLTYALAEATDSVSELSNALRDGNFKTITKLLHNNPKVFFSSMKIDDYYRFLFGLSYQNNIFKLSKGFMDIEIDIAYIDNQFCSNGEVPINAIAYYDESHNTVYQFLYNDRKNPLVELYRQSFSKEDIIGQLHSFIINAVGGQQKAQKFGVHNLKFEIRFYDDELQLILSMFKVVNKLNPDFVEFWNMAFDLTYIRERLINLGADILDVTPSTKDNDNTRFFTYYVDERNKNDYAERCDYVHTSSTTVWIDQMIQFASRRKGRSQYQSFKLDAIGEAVAGVRKLDYSHITNNIGMLPYLDMKTFSFYNIMDVIVQKCIEHTTQDLEYVFTKCLVNNTSYAKCHRQSIYLANRFAKDFYEYGYIIGNNKNIWNEKPSVKFPGAMVGNPLNNSEDTMMNVNDKPSLLANNVVDFDYSSLYPSIILENNIAPNTQYGKIIIENPEDASKPFSSNEHQDMYSSEEETARYSRGGEFLENLMSGNPLEFCKRWMGLGDIHQVISDIIEFQKYNGTSGKPLSTKDTDLIYFVNPTKNESISLVGKDYMPSLSITQTTTIDEDTKKQLLDQINTNKGTLL